jgi:hypothetical protein
VGDRNTKQSCVVDDLKRDGPAARALADVAGDIRVAGSSEQLEVGLEDLVQHRRATHDR